MATTEDVKHLAALARISISDEELPKLASEFEGMLQYVGQLDSLSLVRDASVLTPGPLGEAGPVLRNVFRGDGTPHEKGAYTEKLASQFPDRDGDALSVKQIIQHD
ncbi:MAG: Asp-tRNA(Asn)/Glu-tRNA(Gln) amidotransferase subunit GatC [Minisyncoccia bacterium]